MYHSKILRLPALFTKVVKHIPLFPNVLDLIVDQKADMDVDALPPRRRYFVCHVIHVSRPIHSQRLEIFRPPYQQGSFVERKLGCCVRSWR
ncbi:uncharacterized protein M421DRAFT_421942 [Didymella exigua CBS 183.55]|uniref:Uncharacterized protein n=1 Tax=Didymella exigua CBS 183.55 TaxID=1150837 RepID=A0A6A5RJC8_9PLEO|nr:uncharacterized protein M421DRAFT_421942 [Didymella exigua CBS 183.55]KAF1927074.1 hypothetical protein M421DRAFT_421942 [Didymella exigua CBS 183.55]